MLNGDSFAKMAAGNGLLEVLLGQAYGTAKKGGDDVAAVFDFGTADGLGDFTLETEF